MFVSKNIGYIFLSIFLFGNTLGIAQINLNKYKYIVVPKKFDDFKKENQHQANTLVKHLFTQRGFTTVWDDDLPPDLVNNQCSALFVSLLNKSSMFSTKTALVLKDCNKKEVFTTTQGRSKQKDYKKSFNEAIREAMQSFDGLNYEYVGDEKSNEPITVSFKDDVKKLPEPENTSAKTPKPAEKIIVQEATTEKQTYINKEPVESNFKKVEKNEPIVEQIATTDEQVYKTTEPIESTIKKVGDTKTEVLKNANAESTTVLYAQEITNGFQLVDSTPKVVLKILKTSIADKYLANGDMGNGLVYSKNGQWFLEYYEGENLVAKELNIKF